MRSRLRSRVFVGLAVLVGTMTFGVNAASAQSAFHGIGFVKSCDSPTRVGDPLNCQYAVFNLPRIDTALDTLLIAGVVDTSDSAGGDVPSGTSLARSSLCSPGPSDCVGGSGSGTDADPYVGATACSLPSGSVITTNLHSFYTVKAADFALPGHQLTDTATLLWSDLCNGTSNNCTAGRRRSRRPRRRQSRRSPRRRRPRSTTRRIRR